MKVQWNAFQRQILRSPGSVFVSAGAGTGKTRTIVQKYIDLVTSPGPDSGEVLMITFTDKAAGEMKERILRQVEETIASTDSPQVRSRFEALRNRLHFAWISTIHGFCTRLLREFPLEAGLDPSFEVVSGNVQKLRIKRAVSGYFDDAHGEDRLERLRPFFAYYRFDTTIALFVEALSRKRFDLLESNLAQIQTRTAHTGEDKVIRAALPEFRKAFETMLEEYRLQNARENDVDFDDILLLTLSMLRRNDAVRLQLQQRFRTIVVDEFQDTNALQIQIISLVQGENTQMLYVGDGKQSIYRFNGADVRVFQQMRSSFDAGQVFSLPVNYRSTP
ncbi:MAG TPA: UvrD-helicase domain-containing protein, partial [Thermotogota bacterium]|nr:UvrD-helicase domain-containing protein [Thermotogota bacterium]